MSDAHMQCHLGAFEDGKLCAVVGVYPLHVKIGEKEFLFATTGNVATLPEYEGRGYMNALFSKAMKELEVMGADGARLGGARQRYGRFGYEGCGSVFRRDVMQVLHLGLRHIRWRRHVYLQQAARHTI